MCKFWKHKPSYTYIVNNLIYGQLVKACNYTWWLPSLCGEQVVNTFCHLLCVCVFLQIFSVYKNVCTINDDQYYIIASLIRVTQGQTSLSV